MNGPAIIGTVGLDTAPMVAGFAKAVSAAKIAGKEIEGALKIGSGTGSPLSTKGASPWDVATPKIKGFSGQLKGMGQSAEKAADNSTKLKVETEGLRGALTSAAVSFANGSSAADAFAGAALNAGNSIKGGLALGLGITAALGLGLAMYRAYERTSELSDELRDLSFSGFTAGASSAEEMTSRIGELAVKMKEVKEDSKGVIAGFVDKATSGLSIFGSSAMREGASNEALIERKRLVEETQKRLAGDVEIINKRIAGDEHDADLAQQRLDLANRLAETYARLNKVGAFTEAIQIKKAMEEVGKAQEKLSQKASDKAGTDALAGADIAFAESKGQKDKAEGLRIEKTYQDALLKAKADGSGKAISAAEEERRIALDTLKQRKEQETRITDAKLSAMRADLSGHHSLADRMRIESDFAEKILEANKNNDPVTASRLTKERDLTLEQQKRNKLLESPQQRADDRRQGRRESRVDRIVRRADGDPTLVGVDERNRKALVKDQADRRGSVRGAVGAAKDASAASLSTISSGVTDILNAIKMAVNPTGPS